MVYRKKKFPIMLKTNGQIHKKCLTDVFDYFYRQGKLKKISFLLIPISISMVDNFYTGIITP